MFLQILGVIFLILICIAAYYCWKFYRFVKRINSSDHATAWSVLPSQGLELDPSNSDEWREQERLSYIESELKSVGASHLGYYCLYHGSASIYLSLWNYKGLATPLIYEGYAEDDKKHSTFFFEVASKLVDGSICISTNPNAMLDSRPPNHALLFKETSSMLDLMKTLKASVPKDKKLLRIDDPMEFLSDVYDDTAIWAWKPEQLRSDKTQQIFASVGIKVTDELMDGLIESGKAYSIDVHIDRARRQLARHSKMSAAKWEKIREKLIFVHAEMEVEDIIESISELLGDVTAEQERVLDGFSASTEDLTDPIGAFQMMSSALNLRVKRVARIDTPLKMEVYLPLQE